MTGCDRFGGWVETYVDGELLPEHVVVFEEHLIFCDTCHEAVRFERALRQSTQRATRVATEVSPEFEARLRAAMVAQCHSKSIGRDRTGVPSGALGWRSVIPLSVAAAAALVFAQVQNERKDGPTLMDVSGSRQLATTNAGAGTDTMTSVEEFLDDLTQYYSHSKDSWDGIDEEEMVPSVVVNPSVTSPSVVSRVVSRSTVKRHPDARWMMDRGVPLEPPELSSLGAVWEGAQLYKSRQGSTTNWHYRVGDHRVVVSVYDSRRVPLRVALEPRVARNKPVFVGTRGGCAVAAVETNGIGFAATTDLSPLETAELVAAAVH
jgi:anti-sigma factor RsiW